MRVPAGSKTCKLSGEFVGYSGRGGDWPGGWLAQGVDWPMGCTYTLPGYADVPRVSSQWSRFTIVLSDFQCIRLRFTLLLSGRAMRQRGICCRNVCPSVCLSQSWSAPEQSKISKYTSQHRMIE